MDLNEGRKRWAAFAGLIALSLILWWHPLSTTLRLALDSEAHTHILLIVPLSCALIYLNKDAAKAHYKSSLVVGIPILAAALLLAAIAAWQSGSEGTRLSLSILALVFWWMGSVMLCFGLQTFRSFLFPLCFLLLAVPLPESVLNRIVEFLQYQSAVAARVLFRAVGVPATQDGIMLSIPTLDIEVARECSSIRSSMMLVMTTMVLAHLFLRSWWRQLLLVLVTIPLSVMKNGLRIFTIAELGTRIDRGFLNGKLHHQGGILFFGVAVVGVIGLLWILRRTESQRLLSSQ